MPVITELARLGPLKPTTLLPISARSRSSVAAAAAAAAGRKPTRWCVDDNDDEGDDDEADEQEEGEPWIPPTDARYGEAAASSSPSPSWMTGTGAAAAAAAAAARVGLRVFCNSSARALRSSFRSVWMAGGRSPLVVRRSANR